MPAECPPSSLLAELLTGELAEAHSTALLSHLEDCRLCQDELAQLSDDPELQRWRPAARLVRGQVGVENPYCRAMIERLLRYDTSIDRAAERSTHAERSAESAFSALLTQSHCAGDLGMLFDYRICQELGSGGMAVVFDAIDTQLNRAVAIKVLKREQADNRSKERFLREARAIAALHHSNVVDIYGIATTPDGLPFFAMEKLDGGCLAKRIQQAERISPQQAASWIAGVADGLAAAHEAGLIHRDIKPSNVLLSGDGGVAKLADFGLARLQNVAVEFTQTGVLLGTPAYMSPEHVLAPESADARSDIYALGVTLYETLTGEVPFRGSLHSVLQRIQFEDPAWPRTLDPSIPRDLETICMTAMHRQPNKRYATAGEFADDLRRWQRGEPIVARPVSRAERYLRWCARHPGTTGLVATVATLLLVLGVGSSLAAFSLSSAARSLREERDNLEQANLHIQRTARDADQQRQIAVESLNSLVTKVQAELASRPGTIKLRESILDTAIRGLDKVTDHAGLTPIGHTTIAAHLRKGEIFDLLGQTAQAIEEVNQAEQLARAAILASPGDMQAVADLGDALMMHADTHRKAFDYDRAQPIFEQVLDLREQVAAALPDDRDAQRAVASCVQRLADIQFYRNDWNTAESGYQKLLGCLRNALLKFQSDHEMERDLSIAHERLGTLATTTGNVDAAIGYFEQAVAVNRSLLDTDPDNKLYVGDRANFTRRLASLFSLRGDHDEATRLAREAIDRYVAVADSDPLDTDARMKIGSGWYTLYTIQLAAENLEPAADAARASLEQFAGLMQDFPETVKYAVLAGEACGNLAEMQIRLGRQQEAAESMRRHLAIIDRGALAKDAVSGQFDSLRTSLVATLAAQELALCGVDATNEHLLQPDLVHMARALIMYECARSGNIDKALELGERISSYSTTNPDADLKTQLGVCRAYAVCFRKITAENDSTDAQDDPRIVRVVDGCKKAARQLIKLNPALRDFLWNDRDFRPLREQVDVRILLP